jgi:hypothetical protein
VLLHTHALYCILRASRAGDLGSPP